MLEEKGAKRVAIADLARDDMAEAVEDAFRYNKVICAASSYDGGVFPPMERFLLTLQHKNYQNRTMAILENGSWAPSAGKCMKELISSFKNVTLVEPVVTIRSTVKDSDIENLDKLADAVLSE